MMSASKPPDNGTTRTMIPMTLTDAGMGDDHWPTVAAALAAAYKTLPGSYQNVRVTVPPESDEVRILACMAPGEPEVDVTPSDDAWGRVAARTYRQVMTRRPRDL